MHSLSENLTAPCSQDVVVPLVHSRQFAYIPDNLSTDPRVSDRAYRVFARLSGHYRNYETNVAIVSQPQLARDLGCCVRTIQRALKRLEQAEALVTQRRQDASGNLLPCAYHLLIIGQKTGRGATGSPEFPPGDTLMRPLVTQVADLPLSERYSEKTQPLTADERKHAAQVRARCYGGCRHGPRHDRTADCIDAIAWDIRRRRL